MHHLRRNKLQKANYRLPLQTTLPPPLFCAVLHLRAQVALDA